MCSHLLLLDDNVFDKKLSVSSPFDFEGVLVLSLTIFNSEFSMFLGKLNKLFFTSKILRGDDVLDVIRLYFYVSHSWFLWENAPTFDTNGVSITLFSGKEESFEEDFPFISSRS